MATTENETTNNNIFGDENFVCECQYCRQFFDVSLDNEVASLSHQAFVRWLNTITHLEWPASWPPLEIPTIPDNLNIEEELNELEIDDDYFAEDDNDNNNNDDDDDTWDFADNDDDDFVMINQNENWDYIFYDQDMVTSASAA